MKARSSVPNDAQAECMARAGPGNDWCFRPRDANMKYALERRGWGKCVWWLGTDSYRYLELTEEGKQALARYRAKKSR